MLKNKKYLLVLIFIVLSFAASLCIAGDAGEIPPLAKNDSVLILVPHPDDEAIATSGLIQKALKAGARLKIVLYTNGDNNEPAFIVYEKRLTFRRGEFLHMGEVRRKETLDAMNYLGVDKNNIIFLGYPDFGTMAIFNKYWNTTKPFKSLFARSVKVPYPECLSPGAPYVGESILKDLKNIITDFKPTKIFVSHPADTSGDHRSLYLFLRVALWDLDGAIKQPQVFPYLIHYAGWPEPRGYYPDSELTPPAALSEVLRDNLFLSPEELAIKHKCISFYKSQIEYDPPYLFTFARKNELFGDYPIIKLKESGQDNVQWQDASGFSYAKKNGDFFVRINLKNQVGKDLGMSVSLFGYSKNMDFAMMPKIRISVGMLGMKIKDMGRTISTRNAKVSYEGNSVIIKVPLAGLGNPDYILTSVHIADMPFSNTPWRIIEIR